MKRVLLVTAAIVFGAIAHAQQPQLPPQQQLPHPTPAPAQTPSTVSFEYVARTGAPVRRSGSVTWTCSATSCTIRGSWLQPGVPACAALAAQVGRIVSYGRAGAMLTSQQLAQCNANVPQQQQPPSPPPPPPPPSAPGVEITTSTIRAEGSPDAGAPAPFAPREITTSTIRAEGSPEASAPAPFTPVEITTSTIRAEGAPR